MNCARQTRERTSQGLTCVRTRRRFLSERRRPAVRFRGGEAKEAELDPGGAAEDARRLHVLLPRLRLGLALLPRGRGRAAGRLPALRRRDAPPLPASARRRSRPPSRSSARSAAPRSGRPRCSASGSASPAASPAAAAAAAAPRPAPRGPSPGPCSSGSRLGAPELPRRLGADRDAARRREPFDPGAEVDRVADRAVGAAAARCRARRRDASPELSPARKRGHSGCSAASAPVSSWSASAARAARSAWLSPSKVAKTASPISRSTTPSWRSIAGIAAPKSVSSILETVAGSWCSEKDVKPFRSAKSTVTGCASRSTIEAAEALLRALLVRHHGDHAEREQHQHVPLPPRRLPVAAERDRDHRLGEQDERDREAEHEPRAPLPVEGEVADDREGVAGDPDDREPDERPRQPLGHDRVVDLGEEREADDRPDREQDEQRTLEQLRLRSARCRAAESAASAPASTSPTGVAITKPRFGLSSRTPGVASACRARKPEAARNESETRWTRRSPRRRAATPVAYASTAFSPAVTRTSQKWDGWCCQCTSASGAASRIASPTSGSASSTTSVSGERAIAPRGSRAR